jgi:hypothetical protein
MSAKHKTAAAGCDGKSHRCYQVATIVGDLTERLLREVSRDGTVRLEDALRIMKLMSRGTYELDVAFDAQEKKCRQDLNPTRDKASSRNNPFRRLMVRPFETLLSGDPALYPRPLLANYFDVLEAAYGDKYAEYDRHCKALLQSLLVAHGHNLHWDTFYNEPRVAQILAHALKRLLKYLGTPSGQMAWVQTMSRPTISGLRPSAEQSDKVRETLDHTLRALDMAAPPIAPGGLGMAAGTA